MSSNTKSLSSTSCSEDESELRRGPWTLEEDTLLIQYIARHGEGRWNLLAKRSGLRRTGKSCRLRWLNYLKPDVKRGNLSPEEQLLILDLHSKWGNRWSKIAQYLPGRTDNEIKNYWRTRVQKQARHLKIDTNSTEFQNIIRCFWMPRLLQKMGGESSFSSPMLIQNPAALQPLDIASEHLTAATSEAAPPQLPGQGALNMSGTIYNLDSVQKQNAGSEFCTSSCILPSEPIDMPKMSQFPECPPSSFHAILNNDNAKGGFCVDNSSYDIEAFNLQGPVSAQGFAGNSVDDCYMAESNWLDSDFSGGMWSMEELWQSRS